MLPAYDRYHWQLHTALEKASWNIIDQPLTLEWERTRLFVDFGVVHESDAHLGRAIELKSIDVESGVEDLRDALGQYLLYRALIRHLQLQLELYLAITEEAYRMFFVDDLGALVCAEYDVRLLVFDPEREEIIQWLKLRNCAPSLSKC